MTSSPAPHGDAADNAGAASAAAAARDNACAAVASTLWRERELLEALLFALTSQQLILAAGAVRWLPATDDQVVRAIDDLTHCELRRAVETHQLAQLLELPEEISLEDLARAVAAPWDSLLADHRESLRDLVAEITATTAENRRLLRVGADIVRDTLARVGDATSHFGGTIGGNFEPGGSTGPVLLDRQA